MTSLKEKLNKITNLSNEEVLSLYDEVRGNMSYYNAAEGPSWYQEADARARASTILHAVRDEVKNRKLIPNPGTYLC